MNYYLYLRCSWSESQFKETQNLTQNASRLSLKANVLSFLFFIMETQTISEETLARVKSLPRIDYDAFTELVTSNQVKRLIKFKSPKTIFFDEETRFFLYLNPVQKILVNCGKFIEESEGLNG